jgi:hypothetical protein
MEKRIAGLLGAIATLGTFNAAQAAPAPSPAPTDVLQASSFADLLKPIPNAAALLQAVDQSAPATSANENIQLVRYHHHHHHAHRRIIVVPRYRHHHHHHHHHHHNHY